MLLHVAWDLISVYMYVLLACYNDLVSPPEGEEARKLRQHSKIEQKKLLDLFYFPINFLKTAQTLE